MAKIALMDIDKRTKQGVFNDTLVNKSGQETYSQSVMVGRGISLLKNSEKVVITDDSVAACCERFMVELIRWRQAHPQEGTKGNVKMIWATLPIEHKLAIRSLSRNELLIPHETEIMRALQFHSKAISEFRKDRNYFHIMLTPLVEDSYNAWLKKTDYEWWDIAYEMSDYEEMTETDRNKFAIVTLPLKIGNAWDLISFDFAERKILSVHFGLVENIEKSRETKKLEEGA